MPIVEVEAILCALNQLQLSTLQDYRSTDNNLFLLSCMDSGAEIEQFSNIITPQGVNVDLFISACGQEDTELLAQFVLSVNKILKLYDKPGRKNPFAALDKSSLARMITKLTELQHKLTFTIYELKVRKIVSHLQSLNSVNLRTHTRLEHEQIRKATSTIKVEEVLANPQVLNCWFSSPKNLYLFVINEILPQAGRQILSINDHEKRYDAVCKGLKICDTLIHPCQVEIQISKNTLLETRSFKMKYEFDFQSTQTQFLKQAANIINEALLCPSDSKVQWMLLKILKRMYKLWGQLIHGPLFLNLKNISLFFSDEANSSKMIKQAAIFCYSVVNTKSDLKFIDMLSSCEDLNDLKRNQFYSSKGLALPFEIGTIYDSSNLELPIWKYKLHLDKREFHVYQIIIQKSSTLLFWKFEVLGYDVSFGVYKVANLRKFELEEYDKSQECKPIHKMCKYGQGTPNSKMPTKGQVFVKSGVYHVVFDNSHSMVRGKDIFFQLCHLEANV